MKRLSLLSGVAFALLLLSEANSKVPSEQSEAVVIPLDKIWTNGVGGPGSLRGLEPEYFFLRDTPERIKKFEQYTREQLDELNRKAEQSLNLPIERAMLAKEGKVDPGFAVAGTGRKALQGVYDVLVKDQDPKKRFPAGSDLSIVFFTHPSGTKLMIDRIERRGTLIQIHYKLAYHGLLALTWSLALVPLGELPPGEYRVEIVRSASEGFDRRGFRAVDPKKVPYIICQPFSFEVVDHP